MKVGLLIPQAGPEVTPDLVRRYAQAAESAGYDSLWTIDHVVIPREWRSQYPYTPSGAPPRRIQIDAHLLEPLTQLAYVAAVTSRVELGTSVLVLPMRQPVLHAKIMATIDYLAGGRFILGAGIGWAAEEYEVLSVPFERRGARMDEALQVVRSLWTEDWVDFEGEFYHVDGWTSKPHPPRHLPIWLGGDAPAMMRRIGRLADGWLAPANHIPTAQADFEVAREAAAAAGRDPTALTLAMAGITLLRDDRQEEAAERMHAARHAGVQHAILGLHPQHIEGSPERIQAFAEAFLPALQAG